MKTILILIAVAITLTLLVMRKVKTKDLERPFELVALESDSQSEEYLPIVSKNWLGEIEIKYQGAGYKGYPNEYTELTDKLCSEVYKLSKYWERNQTHTDFLNGLTKQQRIFFTLINFEGQTNNGGVYQFLFNQPELSLIALDAMKIMGIDSLAKDYEIVLQELLGKTKSISELKTKFQDNAQHWTSRWNAFVEGYNELKSTEVIESYFYEDEFINLFRSRIVEYVKANQKNLFIEEA